MDVDMDMDIDIDVDVNVEVDPEIAALEAEAKRIVRSHLCIFTCLFFFPLSSLAFLLHAFENGGELILRNDHLLEIFCLCLFRIVFTRAAYSCSLRNFIIMVKDRKQSRLPYRQQRTRTVYE